MQYVIIMMSYFAMIAMFSLLLEGDIRIVNNKAAKVFGAIIVIGYLLFVYYRPYFFRDTETYQLIYDNVQWSYMSKINLIEREPRTSMEYGFLLLMLLCKTVHIPFRFFSILLSVFFLTVCYKFCKYIMKKTLVDDERVPSNYTFLLFFGIYLSYFGTFYSFVTIRAAICIALLLIASYCVIENKRIATVICFLLAFSMQRFAVLGLIPLYIFLFWNKKWDYRKFKLIWVILGAFIVISFLYQNIIFSKVWDIVGRTIIGFYDFKYDKQTSSLTKGLLYISYWFTGLIIYKGNRRDELSNKLVWIYVVGLILCVLFSGYSSAYRIIDFMYIFTLPLSYSIFYTWKSNNLQKRTIYIIQYSLFFSIMTKDYIFWYLYG